MLLLLVCSLWRPMVAGPGDRTTAGAAGYGHLRASHVDREQVIDTLKAAFVEGRLAKGEFDARVGQAFAARTYADLAALTTDLPASPAGAQLVRKPSAQVQPRRRVSKAVAWGACGLLTPPLLVATLAIPHAGDDEIGLAQWLFLVVVAYFMAWLIAGAQMLDSWHRQRSRGQLPPRQAQSRPALNGNPDDRPGDGLALCQAPGDAGARGRGMEHPSAPWRSQPPRRHRRRAASLHVTA